jgi:hypothetical protein
MEGYQRILSNPPESSQGTSMDKKSLYALIRDEVIDVDCDERTTFGG